MAAAPTFRFILSFDFDGTLIYPEGHEFRFHPSMGEALRGLRQQGAAWVINTGRSLDQTLQGIAQYGLFQEPDFIIAREGELYKPGGFFSKWTDYGSWNKLARKAHTQFMKENKAFLAHVKEVVTNHTKAQFLDGEIGDVGIVGSSSAEVDSICEMIEAYRQQSPSVGYHRNGIYLRFSHSGYSKGTALAELTRLLNLTPAQCFAAGDNFNDLSMLDANIARMIACPGNSLPEVKEHVRKQGGFVANGIASGGMLEAMHHFFGGGAAKS
jgi:HAD superfamily hydrolase (TIGR01484 family)